MIRNVTEELDAKNLDTIPRDNAKIANNFEQIGAASRASATSSVDKCISLVSLSEEVQSLDPTLNDEEDNNDAAQYDPEEWLAAYRDIEQRLLAADLSPELSPAL